jgi:hypothetical protein
MQLIFGRKYASRFGTQSEVNATKRMWAVAFKQQHISAPQIEGAIIEILNNRLEWPPELTEFLKLCDQSNALGLPDLDAVKCEIVYRHGKYRHDPDFAFSCQLVAVINQRCGNQCLQLAASAFEKLLTKEYKRAVFEHKTGTLPVIGKALPAPKLPAASDGYQPANPQSPFMQRLKGLGTLLTGSQA